MRDESLKAPASSAVWRPPNRPAARGQPEFAAPPARPATATPVSAGIFVGEYFVAFGVFVATSLLNLWLQQWLGYQALALVYLLAVVVLALVVRRGPILFGTALTAAGWSYLFAPPRFSFHIASSYDRMMFVMYFVVALTVGQLTARLRAQRKTELKAKLLAESERLGRTLLNSVSHELRTPIAVITTAADSLGEAGPLTPAQQRLASEIEAASARLNRVVQSLLSAARLQSGQLQPKLDWCDVAELVQVSLRSVASLTASHPIRVSVASQLPLVRLDFVLMEQALANLLVNAATHTPPGTAVELAARQEGRSLVLEVSDRGPGLPPEEVERIFDLFHRTPTAKPGGTGLGLNIVKGFVEAQGGRVRAANRVGGGAVFLITLPVDAAPTLTEESA